MQVEKTLSPPSSGGKGRASLRIDASGASSTGKEPAVVHESPEQRRLRVRFFFLPFSFALFFSSVPRLSLPPLPRCRSLLVVCSSRSLFTRRLSLSFLSLFVLSFLLYFFLTPSSVYRCFVAVLFLSVRFFGFFFSLSLSRVCSFDDQLVLLVLSFPSFFSCGLSFILLVFVIPFILFFVLSFPCARCKPTPRLPSTTRPGVRWTRRRAQSRSSWASFARAARRRRSASWL